MTRRPLTLPSPPPGARGFAAIVVIAILFVCFVSSGSPARAADPTPAGLNGPRWA
jgi:hypothetical protein